MVVRVSSVPPKARAAELRIGPDKVFRKAVAPEHLALNCTRNERQVLISCESSVVVENVQRTGQSLVVPIREVVPQVLLSGGAQVHCSGLEHSVERRAHWSETGSSDVDAVEHPV